MAGHMSLHEGTPQPTTLFSHCHYQSPGTQNSTCKTGVNSVSCWESWTGITLNPCGISQTKAGDAYIKQSTQQCLEWSKATKANSTSLCSGFQQVPYYWIFSSRKRERKNSSWLATILPSLFCSDLPELRGQRQQATETVTASRILLLSSLMIEM